MSDKTRRSWFQLHLSTAIVMMVVAGGLLWMNLHRRPGEPNLAPDSEQYYGTIYPSNYDAYGWPHGITLWFNSETNEHTVFTFRHPAYLLPIVIDVLVALLILFVVWRCCEYVVRRREVRAP